jgi:hypothetical protein
MTERPVALPPKGRATMLQQLSPAVQHCQLRAAECERLAELARTPENRNGYLRIAEAWRKLAENREFVAKLEAFLGYVKE